MKLRNGKLFVPEKDVLKGCLEYLTSIGAFVWRSNTGSAMFGKRFVRFGQPGVADVIGVLPGGRFLAVETKREGGKPSDAQVLFANEVAARHGFWICAHSVEELIEELRKVGA